MKRMVILGGIALTLSACATVTRGTTNQVQIRSEPSGAQVVTSLAHNCMTPCTITVNRKDEFSVRFSLAGYKDATVEVRTQVAGTGVLGVAGNAVVGGVIGVGVDVITGSALDHVPNPVVVTLERLGTPIQRAVLPRSPGRTASPIPLPSRAGVTPLVSEPVTPSLPPAPAPRQPEQTGPLSPGIVPPST